MASIRTLKKRTAARITDKMLFAVSSRPDGADVGLTIFESRRRVASIHLPQPLALQLSALISEAATGRQDIEALVEQSNARFAKTLKASFRGAF